MLSGKLIPQRTLHALRILAASVWATSWERIYRQVFWLADGTRDSERIAILLHKSERLIYQVIIELAVAGYLSVQNYRKVVVMNISLLKQSFEMIAPRKEEFASSFYQRLFADYPQTRSLFAQTDMKRQEGALMATLAFVIAGVERGENLTPILQQLGGKHHRYGAQADHYPVVGAVLLETFHEYLGLEFTSEMQDAWAQAFELISAQMLVGARQQAS
jgi:methyl-accepting chemotaxis protein